MRKIIVPILIAALLLTGCGGVSMYSNYREVEHLQIVQTLGMDSSDMGVRLSVSCSKPSSQSSGGIISREGEGLIAALRSLQNYAAEQELYYAHATGVLLGESYAREKGAEALDFVARDTQLRLGLKLYTVRGEASQLITGPGDESYEISRTLSSIERDSENSGLSHVFSARETIRALSDHGAALICALSPAKTEDSVFMAEGGITAVPVGYGVLKEGRLVGWIEPDISAAASLIIGHPGSAGPRLPDGEGGFISLEILHGEVKVKPLEGNRLRLEAKIEAAIAEPDTAQSHITDRQLLSRLEKALADDTKAQMEAVLALSKELEADFLGLGAYLREKPDSWPASAEFEVQCEAKINFSLEMADKMDSGGEG